MESETVTVEAPAVESENLTVSVEASTPSDEPVEVDGAEGATGEAEAA